MTERAVAAWAPGPAWLFCPADRPDRYAKAHDRADVVIVDLEDAVAPADKAAARRALLAAPDLDPDRTLVRLNAAGTAEHAADLDVVRRLGLARVMLPKAQDPGDVAALGDLGVLVLIESPLGLHRVGELVAVPNVVGAMWGAEDLVAGLGGTTSRHPDGRYRDVARYARTATLVAAKAHGRIALDGVHLDIADLPGLAEQCEDGAAVGFDACACIHPGQVPVVRRAYAPTAEQVAQARELLAAAQARAGVFSWRGRMVDGPVLAQARQVLARAERRPGPPP